MSAHRAGRATVPGAQLFNRRAAARASAAVAGLFLVALLGAGCVQYSGSTVAAKVRSWMSSSSFVAGNNTLVDDVARAHLAARRGTALQLRTVCSAFAADVGTAYDELPSPSTSLTATLNSADEAFFRAATLCSQASSVGAPRVAAAFARMAAGERELRRASAELSSLGIAWVPRR